MLRRKAGATFLLAIAATSVGGAACSFGDFGDLTARAAAHDSGAVRMSEAHSQIEASADGPYVDAEATGDGGAQTTDAESTPSSLDAAPDGPKPTGSKPDSSNTGVPSGASLTIVTGDQLYATDGALVMNLDFRGFVRVTANGVTFKNCVFRGGNTTTNEALLDTTSGTNTVVEDSELSPSAPSSWISCIAAKSATIRRANVHGCVDGVVTFGDVLVESSFIHDMNWFASDPNQGGGPTHNDGVQMWPEGQNITLRGNNIDMSTSMSPNAAVQSSAADTHIENNWFDGGACILNFAHQSSAGPLTGIHVSNNRFGRGSFYQCPILISTQTTLSTNTGNVWDDTGLPIPSPDQHD